jgi:3-deoxy-D-manno-octulosonate 8-phosphate phosphatase KdsC-like HAD superfamily phosphatase
VEIFREHIELNRVFVTQAKKAEELIANQVVHIEAIKMVGDDIFDLGIGNKALWSELGKVE